MTPADRTKSHVERAARLVALAATVWFALAVIWGLLAPIGGGHDAQIATRSIVAENMRVWHTLAVVKDYYLQDPMPDVYYVHHPWGTFWAIALFAEVFGRGAWVPRLLAVCMSIATPPLLYGIGRALWGPVPGAISALAYVVLPIALAFGNMPGFEVPVIFGCLLATWGYLRFAQHWERKWMVVSLLGVAAAMNSDWQSAVFVGTVLVSTAAAFLIFPRWFGRARLPQYMEWWVLAAMISGGTLLAYVFFVQRVGMLENLVHSETQRARGNSTPLAHSLGARSYWIDVTFTPLAVTLAKIAAPIFILRVLFLRRINEIFPLAILLMATLQYVMLKNGADVHIYWPMPFAPYWALSLGMLSALSMVALKRGYQRFGAQDKGPFAELLTLALFSLIPLRMLPDGIGGLRYAKATAGRFNEKGKRIFSDVDLVEAMEWMASRMTTRTVVAIPPVLAGREYRGQEWALDRPVTGLDLGPFVSGSLSERYFVGDLRFLSADDQRLAASKFHLVVVGPYFLIDRQEPAAALDAYSFDEREPNVLEWYFKAPSEPIRTVRPDPWSTWELREHFGQSPNPPPGGVPRTPDEIRIAHNMAAAAGNAADADKWRMQLEAGLTTAVSTPFHDGTRLLGKRFVDGVDRTLELYFSTQGPLANDYPFVVTSTIEAPPALSLVPADPLVKEYGAPFVIAPKLWRPGFIYVDRVDIRKRPGREQFVGAFGAAQSQTNPGTPPQLVVGGSPQLRLMTLQ